MSAKRGLTSRTIPWLITAITLLIALFSWFFSSTQLKSVSDTLWIWVVVLGAIATIGLGPIAITIFHISNIRRRLKGQWYYSIVLLVTMVVTIILGVGLSPIAANTQFLWMYNNVYLPMNTTIYALLGLWMISAAFRAFKVRTWEAAVLFVAAFFVIFMNAPFGAVLWSQFGPIGQWVMNIPNSSAMRGIIIASAIGTIVIALRILLGRERGAVGG